MKPARFSIGQREYKCFEGFIPVHRIGVLTILYRFPQKYGLKQKDVSYFVAGYSGRPDYQNPKERDRMTADFDCMGETVLSVKLQVKEPLMRLMYGLAWNPPKRRKKSTS